MTGQPNISMAKNNTSVKLSKSFLGALKGGGNTREAEKRGSSKFHKVFTPVDQITTFTEEWINSTTGFKDAQTCCFEHLTWNIFWR